MVLFGLVIFFPNCLKQALRNIGFRKADTLSAVLWVLFFTFC